jgi:hypothetical protein
MTLDLALWVLLLAHFQDLPEMSNTSYGFDVELPQLAKQISTARLPMVQHEPT